MKFKIYKSIGFLIAAFFISGIHAQKYDRKFNEKFKVNKDVFVQINVTNAEVDVSTWNKNEVSIQAVITVEGLAKKEAQKFLTGWKFEALGNKNKVAINANANRFVHFGKNDFNFDFDMPDIVIPELNLDIKIPEITIPEINIPEINLNLDHILDEIDSYDFNEGDKKRKTFSYKANGKKNTVVIKSKRDWEKFKKSKDYKLWRKDLEKQLKKAKLAVQKIDKKKIHEEIKRAKIAVQNINKEKLKQNLAIAKKNIERMKVEMAEKYKRGGNVIIIEDGKSRKKVKITRKIIVKVPRKATFKLNTRHSKVKLPKGKVSGKVSYGTFNANEINGGDLQIHFSPVDVNRVQESTLSLHNITDATIASVMNSKLSSNSSKLTIKSLENNVDLTNKFGKLLISDVLSTLSNFKLNLSFSEANVNLKNMKDKLRIAQANTNDIKKNTSRNFSLRGNFSLTNDQVKINGKQSELKVKKQ